MASTAPITGSTPGLIRTWLIDHERLIIVAVVAVVIWLGYVKITNIIEAHDKAQLQQAQVVAAAQAQANAQMEAQRQQDQAQLKALSDKVTAQNDALVAANAQLASALSKQQKTDATLPVPDLVNRWAQLVPGTNFSGAVVSGNNVLVTPSNAVATVQELEKVPVLTQQLANETTQKQNDDQVITQANKSIFDLNSQVTGLNKQIVANDNVCKEQIKVVNDEARKGKRKWFIIGYVAGFATKVFLSSKGF